MCRWPLRAPTPSLSISWPIIDSILVTFEQKCNFRDPNLVTFYFYEMTDFLDWMKNKTFHLQYKHFGAFSNRKYEELSYPKKSENVPPHSSNYIENATPL